VGSQKQYDKQIEFSSY